MNPAVNLPAASIVHPTMFDVPSASQMDAIFNSMPEPGFEPGSGAPQAPRIIQTTPLGR